ncbi:MAG: preprotein translocase subunit SecD [Abditibacteriota bacterium]|nr:preprotein translocase subunit SecD [Abditibacteriota bacterium]
MFSRRPVQYLGLALLLAASLAVIYFPIGARPEEQRYQVHLTAPKAWSDLAGKGKTATVVADDALAAAFQKEKLPGALTIAPSPAATPTAPFEATIDDFATSREEAKTRVDRIVQALSKPFPGVKAGAATETEIAQLPSRPLFTMGQYAVFPAKEQNGRPVPAVKLGLDLQGGVNLVLQVRRALFTYTIDPAKAKTLTTQDERDKFASQVRDALAKGPVSMNLDEADVNLVEGSNTLEVRTQAATQAVFDEQRKAIQSTLAAGLQGIKLTEAREPQFYDPNKLAGEDGGQAAGFSNASSDLLDRTVEILRSRVDSLGVSEPQIQKQGTDRIIVQLPGVNDPQKAIEVVGKTAQMTIRLLPAELEPAEDTSDPTNSATIFRDKATGNIVPNTEVLKMAPVIVNGDDVKPTSRVGYDEGGAPAVYFELKGEGANRFGEQTAKNIGRFMPIFLDERCISAPTIRSAITGGSGQISGGFADLDEARSLALLLNSGALPAPIDIVENRTVSATLGTDSLVKSLRAGLIGILAVVVFMILYYRLPGLLANFALVIYCILNLAVFILIGGTLTLPGIAGFLLAIAMSLDTNILVFERLKEEMAIQPTFAAALRAAFSRAWTAILDSHVTTLIASIVLFFLGTGPVKGFALTLGIGVLLSLFSAISVTRLFMWSVSRLGETNRGLFGSAVQRAQTIVTSSR